MKISRILLLSLSIATFSPLALKADGASVSEQSVSFASKIWSNTAEVIWAKAGSAAEILKLKVLFEKIGGLNYLKEHSAGQWFIENADTLGRATLLTTTALLTYIAYSKYQSAQEDSTQDFSMYFEDEDTSK